MEFASHSLATSEEDTDTLSSTQLERRRYLEENLNLNNQPGDSRILSFKSKAPAAKETRWTYFIFYPWKKGTNKLPILLLNVFFSTKTFLHYTFIFSKSSQLINVHRITSSAFNTNYFHPSSDFFFVQNFFLFPRNHH